MKSKNNPFHLLATLVLATSAHAANFTWTNGDANLTWDTTSANWNAGSGNTAWVDYNDAIFGATGAGAITVSGTQTVASLTTNANGYSLASGQIDLGSADTAFAINNDISIGSVIGGSNGLTKSGAGMLTLSSVNTYSGGTTVSNGVLELSGASGGTGIIRGTATVNAGAELRGTGGDGTGLGWGGDRVTTLNINGGLVSSATNTHLWHATLNMTGGEMQVNGGVSNPAGPAIQWCDVAANILASASTATISGHVNLRSDGGNFPNAVFDVADGAASPDLLVSAAVTDEAWYDAVNLVKTGAGTMTLTAVNSYHGSTTVNEGVLELSGATGGTGIIRSTATVNAGAELRCTGGDGTGLGWGGDRVTTLNINGGLVDSQGGDTHLWFATLNMTGGELRVNDGVNDPNGSAIQWTSNVTTSASASTAIISGRVNLRGDNGSFTNAVFDVADGAAATDLLVSAAVTNSFPYDSVVSLTKTGAGTMSLAGTNTYIGNTNVNAGTLVLADDAELRFAVTDAPAANMVTGTGTATFNGDFSIDTTSVSGVTGYIWLLVDRANLTGESFGSTFSVIGFDDPDDDGVWTMTDSKGDWSFDEATGELTLDVGTDYESWKTANGVTGGENDDDDHDGLTNHEEYAFGLDPTGGSSVNPITSQLNKSTGKFTYTRRDTSLPDPPLTYTIWYSTDLATWTQDIGATESVTGPVDGVETVEVTLTPALLTNPKLFIQVRAQ